jgi:hypothetical protein
MAVNNTELLPCGRDPITVADHARSGHPDDHERACPHCQSATHSAELTQRAARDLAAQPVHVPPTLLPKIMRRVWSELRPTGVIPLASDGADGDTNIAIRALVDALRYNLDRLDDLTVHTCRVDATGNAAGNGASPALTVQLAVSATHTPDLPRLAIQCRRQVAETLHQQFGLHAARVDVDFVDLDPPTGPA